MNSLREEKKAWQKGYKRAAGLDEAGRGSLAGPVVAAALSINPNKYSEIKKLFKGLKDSKCLSSRKREEFFSALTKHPQIKWGIGIVSEKVIDRINILEATKLAMVKAIKKFKTKPDFLIIDGNFRINLSIPQKSIIKADEKVFSCSAASVLAKVTRDRLMGKYHLKYPKYRFNKHKGYPTKLHKKLLKKHGPCKIHRKSFSPVEDVLNK